MGIYDRDYYKAGQGGGGRAGGLGTRGFRLMSVNGWLIAINIAVFVLGMALVTAGRPVPIAYFFGPDAPSDPSRLISPAPPARGQVRTGTTFDVEIRDRQGGAIVGSVRYTMMDPLMEYGHFSTGRGFLGLEVWRFITFQFLHANLVHLFFNMLGLFIFGSLVEQSLGSRRYAAFYLVCGVFGALMYLALNFLGNSTGWNFPGFLPGSVLTPLIGASAGVFGVIVASAYVAPNVIVQLLFPPIPLKLKTMAYAYVAIALINLLMGGRNAGGDAAHIGGAIAGFFFIRNAHLLRDFFDVLGDSRKRAARAPKGSRSSRGPGDTSIFGRSRAPQEEVDRILTKVKASGLQSLTEEEKRILREATERQRGE